MILPVISPVRKVSTQSRDCVTMGKLVMAVILSEAKNLIISKESITEILRLPPQNDIATQSPQGVGATLVALNQGG